jgi:hypothetical protein
MVQFEEAKLVSNRWGWVFIAGLCVVLLALGLGAWAFIPDPARTHNYPVLPDAPGESIYSSRRTPAGTGAGPQLAPLPEAQTTTPPGAP